jgi:purine-binding chemotaxis protein CheW
MTDEGKIIIKAAGDLVDVRPEKKNMLRVLCFSLGGEDYCIEVREAREVVRLGQVTHVPNTPAFIVGVVNLRGEIIPLVDIRYFFGLKEREEVGGARVIVTDTGGFSVGILVDAIDETLKIDEDSIQPPLVTIKGKMAEYTRGQVQLGDTISVLLDLKRVLNCDEINKLKKGEGI